MKNQANIYVSQKAALTRGSSEWGPQQVDLEGVLALLDESEREQIRVTAFLGELPTIRMRGDAEPLVADSTAPDDVAAAVRTELDVRLTARVATIEKARARLERMLIGPEEVMLCLEGSWACGWSPDDYTALMDAADPTDELRAQTDAARRQAEEIGRQRKITELEKKIDHALAEHPGAYQRGQADSLLALGGPDRREEIAAAIAEADRAQTEREEETRKKRDLNALLTAKSAAIWAEWAREHGSEDLKAALSDGYPVGQRAEREVVDHLMPPAPESIEVREDDECVDNGERRVPNAAARQLRLDLIETSVGDHIVAPGNAVVAVGRIMAVSHYVPCECAGGDYPCGECDDDQEVKVRRTAVAVTVTAPHHTARRWYVLTE